MSTPSLLNIPYVIKAGTLYSQIPETGAGDFAVTRATSPANNLSTRVNSLGFIERVNDNVPRLDYPLGGAVNGCAALLVEPSAVNSVLQSEAWNVSPWVATSGSQGATVSGNVTASPDGTTNADKLVEAAVPGNHFCLQSLTLTSGTTYTASFFVKASERTRGRLRTSGSAAYWDVDFNLTSGTVSGGTNPFIQNFGNGWYRIGATFTANQASNTFILFLLDASGAVSYTGDGTSGLFVFGAQIEVGSIATSYIPTTTQAITRGLDSVVKTGITSLIGQSEGTIYLELELRNSAAAMILFLDVGGSSQYIRITKQATTNAFSVLVLNTSGSTTLFTSSSNPVGIYKLALAYKSGDNAMSINGATPLTSANTSNYPTSSLSRIVLSESVVGLNPLNDRIRAVALFPNRLTNAQLQTLTTP
jgi:hypothetical protein